MSTKETGKPSENRSQSVQLTPKKKANAGFNIPKEIRDATPRKRADYLIDNTVQTITLADEKKISAALRSSLGEIRERQKTLEAIQETHQPRVDKLKDSLRESEKRNTAANAEIDRLRAQLTKDKDQWSKEKADLKRQLDDQNQTIIRLDAQLPSIQDRNVELKKNLKLVSQELKQKTISEKELSEQFTESMNFKARFESLEGRFILATNENDQLREQIVKLEEQNHDLSQVQRTNEELQAQLDKETDRAKNLSETLESYRNSLVERENSLIQSIDITLEDWKKIKNESKSTDSQTFDQIQEKVNEAVELKYRIQQILECSTYHSNAHFNLKHNDFQKTAGIAQVESVIRRLKKTMEDMLNDDAELLLAAINTTTKTFNHWKGAKKLTANFASAELDDAVTEGLNLQCDVKLHSRMLPRFKDCKFSNAKPYHQIFQNVKSIEHSVRSILKKLQDIKLEKMRKQVTDEEAPEQVSLLGWN